MTQAQLERTVREWALSNPRRGARELGRLSGQSEARSPEELVESLICAAARLEIARNRAW